ncbi:MAG: hypothetical protein AAGA48_13095 [Myxococcota bacterium]
MWWWCALSLASTTPEMSDAERAETFAEVLSAAAAGDEDKMTDALLSIVKDDAKAGAHGQAWAMLSTQFARREWKLSAIAAFSKGFDLDPAYGIAQIGSMLDLASEVGEDGMIGKVLSENPDLPVPNELTNRVRAMAVRWLLRQGDYGPALAIAEGGQFEQPGFGDLEMLRGVVLSQQERFTDAVAPLLTAEALARKQDPPDPEFLERTHLNVARAFYASGDFGRAIEFYAKVPRTSDSWLEAQFERAWSHFRGQDTNGALAMLHNHQAPFFQERFDPEADLLRAYSLFLMCKFGQASAEMEGFQQRWQPVIDTIDALSDQSGSDALNAVRAFREGNEQPIPPSALRSFRAEPRMSQALASVDRATKELAQTEDAGELGTVAASLLKPQRDARIETEGARAWRKVRTFRDELYNMLTDIELARVDLLTMEAEMLQRAAATGELETVDNTQRLRKLRKRKGFRPWPWQGEYWADEVGWYVFASRPDCPRSLSRGDEEAP